VPQPEQRRRPVLPCLQLPCLQPASHSSAGSVSAADLPDGSSADCGSCGVDAQRSTVKTPGRILRRHRHSDGSLQQQPQAPQQNTSRWQCELDAANACQRIHSSPASTSRDALGMYGQLSAPMRAPLLAPPPAFQLTSLAVAAAAGSSNSEPLPQLPPQRSNSAVLSSSTGSSSSSGGVPARVQAVSSPVNTASTSPAELPSQAYAAAGGVAGTSCRHAAHAVELG
jgi:hypothetical protein